MQLRHQGLLSLADEVYDAADDGDPQRLEQAAEHFLDALSTHVGEESTAMNRLTPPEARILRRSQARLLTLAAQLYVNAAHGCPRDLLGCANRAEELHALLVLYARDERLAWHDIAA